MLYRSWMRRIALAAAAGGVALVLAAAPFAPGAALAKGASNNGVDNSGGKAGGNGNGHGRGGLGGQGGSAPGWVIGNSGVGGEDGPGNGHGLALGHDNDAVSGVDLGTNDFEPLGGEITPMLGRLNAAHASPNAMAVAAENSAVGLTALYYDALAAGEKELAAGFLADLANKQVLESDVTAVVRAYNELLRIEVGVDDVAPTGSGVDHYSGFQISGTDSDTTEYDLIEAAKIKLEGEIGGGLGPAPEE